MLCEKDNLCILITEYVIREGAPTGPLKVIRESHWKNSLKVYLTIWLFTSS
ncbi:MAG: Uncharacterised protein [Chloroflexota bacterium]|nr:MAG: Uncharacterised protein [Chloroflexota bacterium]